MVKIYSSDLMAQLVAGAKIQQLTENVPSQLADKVVPVMEVNPKLLRSIDIAKSSLSTNSLASTIYLTPNDIDFYITNASLSIIKDVNNLSTYSTIQFVQDKQTKIICAIAGLTATAQTEFASQTFISPIKVDRNTSITIVNSEATAKITCFGCIQGYLDYSSKA